MSDVVIATLGERPGAVTFALDLLTERYPIRKAVILYTTPAFEPIRSAHAALRDALQEAPYPTLPVVWREIRQQNGEPLKDIDDEYTGGAYFRGVYDTLVEFRQEGILHLVVAGGRKVMSIYATLAAALVFRGRDFLWSIHSPPELVRPEGPLRIPPLMRDRVRLVRLPLRPIGFWKDSPPIDLDDFLQQQWDLRSAFLASLTDEERAVALAVERHPDASNRTLGRILNKSGRTIENQLSEVYSKLIAFLNIPEPPRHKRKVLLDFLRGAF